MKKNNIIYLTVFILVSIVTLPHAAILFLDEMSDEISGTKSFRVGNYQKALEELQADTIGTDSSFLLFKFGCIQSGLKDYSKALFYFRLCAQRNGQYTTYAFEKIAEIEYEQGRFESALKAYRVAVDKTTHLPYRYTLYRKMYAIAMKHAETIGTINWLEDIVGKDKAIPESSLKDIFIKILGSGKSKELDSALQKYINIDISNKAQCYICKSLSSDSRHDSILSTKTLYLLSKLAYTCRMYKESSEWLHKTLERKDFSKEISNRNYIYHRSILNYRLKNYSNVVKWGKKYNKHYGADPALVYKIARSYRNMGMIGKASYWYDLHIKRFPSHRKTHDIIWYRAWQKEDASRFNEARKFYKKLFKQHRKRSKADDGHFRYALTYCKERDYADAVKAFSEFIKRNPSSRFVVAARFWRAKSFFALRQYNNAKKECKNVIKTAPTNYYAYRSRELMELMGEKKSTISIDTTRSTEETFWWLDSVSNKDSSSFTQEDSITFNLGYCLASMGMLGHAELLLEPFEVNYYKDLQLQYELARLYQICGDPTRSFRVAKRLSWRIPSLARMHMPMQIYSLLFPGAFSEYIDKAAAENDVEPELVTSIIRQESIFNPKIVSPVGAIGLMQIMPYTGEEIASDLNERDSFTTDSLYNPAINVRYGTFYIKKLLKQFDGNSVLAIAGYNGGPHNAKKWNAQNSDDGFDMFIEDIGFSETRSYVKKVLGNYWTYKELSKFRKE